MAFSTNIFLLYFLPAFLLVYFIVPHRFKNIVLLLFSIVFYAYGAPDFVLILLASTVVNFYLVKAMHKAKTPAKKKLFCALAVILCLGLLAYFKYANFFIDNFCAIMGWFGNSQLSTLNSTLPAIMLPIGISFFSFQSVTYIIDTYRGHNEPMEKLTDYMLYITMFPQLIAGPIVRYGDIARQITHRNYRWSECLHGFYRFVIGLCKKVLIADVIGAQVDTLLAGNLTSLDTGTAWITIMAYTFQLYFDFSGYSDMAIGLGRIMGFSFPENFDNPYNSASITEFWRRWHKTLNAFMLNYLYIPLGGNRKGKGRTYLNLWIVFLLSGLWHGASWNFVLWGAYHGCFLVMERLFLGKWYQRIGKMPGVIITFIINMIGWAIFRIEDLNQIGIFIGRLFAFDFAPIHLATQPQYYITLAVAFIFSFIGLFSFGKNLQDKVFYTTYSNKGHAIAWPIAMLLFFFSLAALNASGFSPFIYFRF